MADPNEPLDRDRALQALHEAVGLQYRSLLGYVIAAASLTGLAQLALGRDLARFADAEVDDLRRLIEKLVDLGGRPPTAVPALEIGERPERVLAWLIEAECEAIGAIHAVIDTTGGDAPSEALEHRIEHIVMRKHEQLDLFNRATGIAKDDYRETKRTKRCGKQSCSPRHWLHRVPLHFRQLRRRPG